MVSEEAGQHLDLQTPLLQECPIGPTLPPCPPGLCTSPSAATGHHSVSLLPSVFTIKKAHYHCCWEEAEGRLESVMSKQMSESCAPSFSLADALLGLSTIGQFREFGKRI